MQRRPLRRVHPVVGMRLPLTALIRMIRDPRGRGLALLVVSLFAIGTIFYALTESWSLVDSFYFSTMTLATVGFGDLVPTHPGTKLFTVFYVLAGVGILVAFFSELTRRTIEIGAEMRGRDGQDRGQPPPP